MRGMPCSSSERWTSVMKRGSSCVVSVNCSRKNDGFRRLRFFTGPTRNPASSRKHSESANIPYRIVGGMRFYDRAEVKDLLGYMRVATNPADDMSLLRIINNPPRGIGKTTVTRLLDRAAEHGRGLWSVLQDESLWSVGSAAHKRLVAFRGLISNLQELVGSDAPLGEIGAELVERTGYVDMLRHDDTPEADARFQNVQELVASMDEFRPGARPDVRMADFLENVTLQTSADEGVRKAIA